VSPHSHSIFTHACTWFHITPSCPSCSPTSWSHTCIETHKSTEYTDASILARLRVPIPLLIDDRHEHFHPPHVPTQTTASFQSVPDRTPAVHRSQSPSVRDYVNPPSSSSSAFLILSNTPVFQLSSLVT
jgi:hypothetical protein